MRIILENVKISGTYSQTPEVSYERYSDFKIYHLSQDEYFICDIVVFSFSSSLPTTELDRSSRIVNGFEIDISEIPYQATLWRKSSLAWAYRCGASIISTDVLVTAAHCIEGYESNPSLFRVSVATSDRLSGGDSYEVSKIFAHEGYSSFTLEHDIGLLVTSQKMKFSYKVNAISIAEPNINIPPGKSALVSGFGTTSYQGTVSKSLLAASVNIISQEECTRAYLQIAAITPGMICASANNPPRDACLGDSGGPLVADNTLIGIVSWGEGCATYPGVYTRVSDYYSWIVNKIALA
ncbi:trypsin-3-like [Melitaea cinxia]|uniref:trypsin-3-like n=1 Tax=Melitaea cinxia TaxID=113334 RepID=UPI001E26F7DE|nr:trypsin-3-like [Melitaea cinxia]